MEVSLFEIVWDTVYEMGYILQTYGTTKGGVLMINELVWGYYQSHHFGVLCQHTFLICPSGMHGIQQGTQCIPPQYVPATSLQAAGQMTGQTGHFCETFLV